MPGNQVAGEEFVVRVLEREQVAYADRLDIPLAQVIYCAENIVLVERRDDLAVVIDPLVHFQHVVPGYQRGRFAGSRIVHVLAVHPAHDQRIAGALRGDERHARTLAFEKRVGRNGGTVNEAAQIPDHWRLHAQRLFGLVENREYALFDFGPPGRNLLDR